MFKVKAVNQTKLKEVMPKAEKLKQKLLDEYAKEHQTYKENIVIWFFLHVIKSQLRWDQLHLHKNIFKKINNLTNQIFKSKLVVSRS